MCVAYQTCQKFINYRCSKYKKNDRKETWQVIVQMMWNCAMMWNAYCMHLKNNELVITPVIVCLKEL
jgi:hypothetical protein